MVQALLVRMMGEFGFRILATPVTNIKVAQEVRKQH